MDREVEAALMLQNMAGFTPAIQLRLLARLKSFAAIFSAAPEQLSATLDLERQVSLKRAQDNPASLLAAVEKQNDIAQRHQATILPITHECYPSLLKEISSPPPLLFVLGELETLSLPQIGVVGSRRPTAAGSNNATAFSRLLAASGFAVTSGLALGVDAQAHRGALQAGKTIAVTATGVDGVYPKQHLRLQQAILAAGGAVVTEFLPGTPPKAEYFPRRNRIISGMSLGVLVVEAALKSGSLITARAAANQGREVFAIPGSIHNPVSRGCHQLIKDGAKLVETAEDIVQELAGMLAYKRAELREEPDSDEEQQILTAMGYDPIDIDRLIELTAFDIAELNPHLVTLEMKGLIENRDGFFIRC